MSVEGAGTSPLKRRERIRQPSCEQALLHKPADQVLHVSFFKPLFFVLVHRRIPRQLAISGASCNSE